MPFHRLPAGLFGLTFQHLHPVLQRRQRALLVLGAGALLLTACGGEDEFGGRRADGVVEHPVADSIPHYDRDHIRIDRSRSLDEMANPPEHVAALADYLEDPEATALRPLDVIVNGPAGFYVASVGEGRLIILDRREQRLLEYDLETDESTRLAEQGQGPGDVHFTEDMARNGASLYVAMSDRRIARFDCESAPCAFEEQTGLDFSALAVAPVIESTLAVLGSGVEADDEEYAVRLVNEEGRVQDAFGTLYVSQVWVVRRRFTNEGLIQYSDEVRR